MWDQLHVPKPDPRTLTWAKELGISSLLVQLMLNRGLDSLGACQRFLDPQPHINWPDPLFGDELRQLFSQLLQTEELITVHGDYDADGLTGTTILYTFLKACGFNVQAYLPTRSEGYGLNTRTIETLSTQGTRLLITVDCGISNYHEIEQANHWGITTIITDHHGMPAQIPPARFVLHPQVLKIPELMNLAGVGVAYWLVTLLYDTFAPSSAPPLESWLELVAMGTLADMTPLQGLNRDVVKLGMQQLAQTTRPGLLALCELRNLKPADLTEQELNFQIIPSLNAAGRVETPKLAMDLLLSETAIEAQERALELQHLNQIRQQWCQEVLAEALARLHQNPNQNPIVMASETWPHGVLGIVCAQLVEISQKPVFLLAIEGGIGKASVRAPVHFHVLDALTAMQHHLIKFGGHAQAGGFSIAATKLADFERDLAAYTPPNPPLPPLTVDAELNPAQLSLELYQQLRTLAPFGMGNSEPLFLSLHAPLTNVRPDRSQKHLFAHLGQPDIEVKAWKKWNPKWLTVERADVVYQISQNTWRNKTSLSLQVKYLRETPKSNIPLATVAQAPVVKPERTVLSGALYDHTTATAYVWPWGQPNTPMPIQLIDYRHWLSAEEVLKALQERYDSQVLWWNPDWMGPTKSLPAISHWQHLALGALPALNAEFTACIGFLGIHTWHLLPAPALTLAPFDFGDLLALAEYLQALHLEPIPLVPRLAALMGVAERTLQAQMDTFKQLKLDPLRLESESKCYNLNDSPAFIQYHDYLKQEAKRRTHWHQMSLEKIKEQLE